MKKPNGYRQWQVFIIKDKEVDKFISTMICSFRQLFILQSYKVMLIQEDKIAKLIQDYIDWWIANDSYASGKKVLRS